MPAPGRTAEAKATKFSPGMLIADGLAEVVENSIGEMEGMGLSVIGITAVVKALKAVGADNAKVVSGLDFGLKTAIRAAVSNPPLRDFLIQTTDAYWDKVKILSENASPDEVKRARGQGIEAAKAKIKGFLDKKTTKKPYHAIDAMLPPLVRAAWFAWWLSLDARERERFEAVKPLVENTELIVYVMGMPANLRLEYLEMTLKGKPSILETLKDAALGRETPWTRDANLRVRAAEEKAKQIAKKQGEDAEKLRENNAVTWVDWALRGGIIALVGAVAYVIMRIM